VTTATGVQRRLDVGSDVTTINVDSVMRVAPIKSLTDLLDTRIPGATVLRSSGTPGDPSRIRLRRAASIQESNDPIVIVDGVRITYNEDNDAGLSFVTGVAGGGRYAMPSALDQIDPNTIEKIDVFKGPSASAMYGSDAANGVIVITTKKGRPGQTRWSLGANVGVNQTLGEYPTLNYSFGHIADGTSGAGILCPRVGATPCTIDSVITFQALNDPRYSPFKDG
jgi:TonB-dependent SusC/RagA subfamily outer membrane receptor